MRLVACKDLKPDMQLARSVYKNGCVYLREGLRDINKYVKRLEMMGIYYVYVTDPDSIGIEVPDVVTEQTREKCKSALINTFCDFDKKGVVDVDKIAFPAHCLMQDIIKNMDVQISLADISISDEYTFGHSVSTAVYATLIASNIPYFDEDDVRELAMAALLHDIGKTRINGSILRKENKLTDKEFEHIKQHPVLGYDLLKNSVDISERVRLAALHHHERLDGKGYPDGISGDQIDTFSRIVAIADVYDALTSTRCYRPKWKLNEAAQFLSDRAGKEFDLEFVTILLKKIAMYPNGTKVLLSDGRYAIVAKQNKELPHCPIVRVIEVAGRHVRPYDLDLAKNRLISIVEM